ncbi:MAG: glycosyltransferase [Acidobacteria bacterium]|nr:glycosyltransferase [Acidobacteriota bacterium]
METASSSPLQQNLQAGGGRRLQDCLAEKTAPLVTVITAVFNGQPFIAGCLESVLRQDYPNIEHLIFDGGSTDGTIDVLRRYSEKVALWRSGPDRGVYDAWNKGLSEAQGDWICFLGADDEFLPGAVSEYMKLATQYRHAEYLSSQIRWVHPSGYVNPAHGRAWSWQRFSKNMCVAHVGSMHKRSLFDRLGTYDISYRSAADYELLLRAREGLCAAYMPLPTVMMRAGGVSDNQAALLEAKRAKISSGGRSPLLAHIEFETQRLRFALGPLRRSAGKWLNI